MFFGNFTLAQFLVIFGSVSALLVALYLLDRSRRRQVVSTLRFWVAAEQPAVVHKRKRIQQPLSLLLQIASMALLLLAIGQLRLGSPGAHPRDHVLILDTSAWMSAKVGQPPHTLMDEARQRALAYINALPTGDRVMLVRADALATPTTSFESDRKKLVEAVRDSQPGSTALNLDQALALAQRVQAHSAQPNGEIAFVGAGRVAGQEVVGSPQPAPRNLRVVPVSDPVENCGLRKIGLRRSVSDPQLWEIYVSARNYGSTGKTVTVALGFGGSPIGARRLSLPPGAEREMTFEHRTHAAGLLEARLLPGDAFPDDDTAILELPAQPLLNVTVYSAEPDLLRPVLEANPRVSAIFRNPSEYRSAEHSGIVILDRFRPSKAPSADAIWIDPPMGSPVPVRNKVANAQFARWHSEHPLGAGLRTRDLRLASVSVFEAASGDIKVGEVESGPVIVARPGKPKTVVLGFHPALSAMRYELAMPLLFANILRWMEPGMFRRWELSGASVGTVNLTLDSDVKPSVLRVVREDGALVPFTLRGRVLHFFSATRGTVRVLTGDQELVYSLTLPELWERKWQPPASAKRGIPAIRERKLGYRELWHWLAVLGGLGLLAEWLLFGRMPRMRKASRPLPAAQVRKAS